MVGRRAAARRKAGGKQHVGRPSLPREEYRAMVAALAAAARGCEYCERTIPPARLEPHHVVKRSAGGGDTPHNLVMLCARCHRWCDNPYAQGRLVIEPNALDPGTFRGAIRTGPDKRVWTETNVVIIRRPTRRNPK